jgi:prenyltransferase beta subunit
VIGRRSAAAVVIGLVALVPVAAQPATGAPSPANQARLDSTIRYLQEVQNADGGFGGDAGQESGQGFSAWVALALAAAGINPQDQAQPGGADAYGFLVGHFRQELGGGDSDAAIPTTAFERELMVVNASGTDPHRFAGYDLVAEILGRARPDGSFPYLPGGRGEINDTVFAILALAPVDEPAARTAVQRAADWLIGEQDESGGWSWEVKGGRPEVDLTGAAIQALIAADRPNTDAQRRGIAYLRHAQRPDGGFPELPGEEESNVASTAWAVQAIWSVGEDPETWLTGAAEESEEPLGYLESLQEADGHIRWKRSNDVYGVWMTAYVAPAFAGQAWPIPAAPRAIRRAPAPEQPGPGGEGAQAGGGVIAGGGGTGAPLFSRPKPQSRGRTPGGARQTGPGRHAVDHSKTRRGENAEQPTATLASEPRHASAGSGDGTATTGAATGGRASASTTAAAVAVGSAERGAGGEPALPSGSVGEGRGREVSGTLVGASAGSPRQGSLAFGAPGLHGAGAKDGGAPWLAIAIAAAALLLGLAGSRLEWRHGEVLP